MITACLLMWILTSHKVESSQGKCFYWGFESLSRVSSAETPAEYPNTNNNNRFLSFSFPSCPARCLFPSPQPPCDIRKPPGEGGGFECIVRLAILSRTLTSAQSSLFGSNASPKGARGVMGRRKSPTFNLTFNPPHHLSPTLLSSILIGDWETTGDESLQDPALHDKDIMIKTSVCYWAPGPGV